MQETSQTYNQNILGTTTLEHANARAEPGMSQMYIVPATLAFNSIQICLKCFVSFSDCNCFIPGVDLVSIKPIHNVITMQEDITTDRCRQVNILKKILSLIPWIPW